VADVSGRRRRAAEAFAADLADEAECARCCRPCSARFRPRRRGGQQRLALRIRRVAELQLRRDGAPLARQHRTRPSCWRVRCTRTGGAERRGCVVNLLDQKLWNPNPDYLSTRCEQGRAGSRHHAAGAGAGAAGARVRRGAGRDAAVGRDERAPNSNAAHRMTPLQRSSTPRTWRAPCASCSNRRPSPAPRCWSTAASTCRPSRAT
jgi:hypothetical protein